MAKTEATVTINAPIEKVFNAVADPKEIANYAPSGDLTNTKGEPGELGSIAEWDYHMAGMTMHSIMTVSEVEKPNKIVNELSGALPGKWTWILADEGNSITVYFSIEYDLPGGVLGKIADKLFLGRINQKNLEETTRRLKAYCEK